MVRYYHKLLMKHDKRRERKNIVVMKSRIEKIKSLSGSWMESYFFPPASESEISEYEKSNNIIIPKSYKEFLMLTNGARIFGSDMCLYGVSGDINHYLNYDFTDGSVPEELLILGDYNDTHICYDNHDDIYVLYRDEKYECIKEECVIFDDFCEVLDFAIDVVDEEDE